MTHPTPIIPLKVLQLALSGERFLPIPIPPKYGIEGYIPNNYVSDHGRAMEVVGEKVEFRPGSSQGRYLQDHYTIDISGEKVKWRPSRHQVVLLAFVGPPPKDKKGREFVVCHLDGDRENNHLYNLRYDTHAVNAHHKHLHGTHPTAKFTLRVVWEGRWQVHAELRTIQEVVVEMAESHGTTFSTARNAVLGRSWEGVPMPGDHPSPEELAKSLGVPYEEALVLLRLKRSAA